MDSLKIKSGQGDYQVDFFLDLPALIAGLQTNRLVLIDQRVLNLYQAQLAPLISTLPVCILNATEEEKTLTHGVQRVLHFFQAQQANKETIVLAIGGGIVQDIASFASHIFYRGLRWEFVPTTLLSMSDSCIGAKCGINLNDYKNQIGAFHSPTRVLMCTNFAQTLTDDDLKSGYGEILKLALTGSREFFSFCRQTLDAQGFRRAPLEELIYRSLMVKRTIIEADEYEKDLRRILNYGHTFGHALESLSLYRIPHGAAVAWGLDLVNFISLKLGLLASEDYEDIHQFLVRHFYPLASSRTIVAKDLLEAAKRDKKNTQGHLNLVLLREPGRLEVVPQAFGEFMAEMITEFLDTSHALCRS